MTFTRQLFCAALFSITFGLSISASAQGSDTSSSPKLKGEVEVEAGPETDQAEPEAETQAQTAEDKKALAKDLDSFFDSVQEEAESGDIHQGCTPPEDVA